jgi:2-C-methyl-D-erythritol 4-phosphate cytidylyltransferase
MYKVIALVMAAGTGSRAGHAVPKQYLKINNQSILALTIEKFVKHKKIDAVICVIHRDHEQLYYDAVPSSATKLLPPIIGGDKRQDSVRLGLDALKAYQPQYVLIHDAVRIFVSHITQVVEALHSYDAVALGARSHDTLWQELDGCSLSPIARDNAFQIQTPQAFRYDLIASLHNKYRDKIFTDDLGLLVHDNAQHKIKIIESSLKNFKITTAEDLCIARALIKEESCL